MSNYAPPALSRRVIVETALSLIDRDGYAAFSLPRLGEALGVRTPSLYHHFRDRSEILMEVAKMVVLQTEQPPRRPGDHWTDYFVEISVNFRRSILKHRNAAPILVQYLPRDVLTSLYEVHAAVLREESDLPLSSHVLVLDGLERLTIGTALIEAARSPNGETSAFPETDPKQLPRLTSACEANTLNAEQLFVASIRAFLTGVETAAREGRLEGPRGPTRP